MWTNDNLQGWVNQFTDWRERHINDKQFVLILSFLVGVCTALAACLLKFLVEWIKEFLTENFDSTGSNWLYLVYPVIGILLASLFVRGIVRDDISHGVTKILYAISRKQSRIKRHNMWSSIIASGITIGFGGSVGAEAPIVLTGSAIGSNLGSLFRMDHKTLMLLVGCGAAGAVSGIFKAPIAGLVFTLEVLMIDLTMASLLPLLISSVTATIVSYILTGTQAMFPFHLDDPFAIERVPYAIGLGIFCGLVAFYFTRAMNWIENIFRNYTKPYAKFLLGGSMLSILIYLFPPLYGEGYDTITLLLNGSNINDWETVMNNSWFYGYEQLLAVYLFLIILFKVFASSATNGGGGCGGIFAPSLFLGCIAGFVFSYLCNRFDIGGIYVPEKNFALMGMAGLMSGVMHAPLTGVFLIAELTGGYQLFLPLMIVSVCAYLTIIVFEPHSIYSMRLAKKGELLTHHKDKAVLTLMNVESVIETDFLAVQPDMDLGTLVRRVISQSNRHVFPVVDARDQLIGVVLLSNIRKVIFRQELYHRYHVEQFMEDPATKIINTDSMEEVMRKFDSTKSWYLPVVDEENRYIGFVSKSKALNTYRQVMVDLSEE
ncbi:MAG: chloride channel protein [Bacteroidales bacterium]|nr:chloride channel protein [Bacteroidales bacterium]